ncbi:hypothetical protein STCU_10355 [Strigomonas culicis]|uniref:Uncharacterized protein n=1 Tax=Strigomonas culicis TaxID=28005 RepID=S9V4R3_9TRYP|nr:hypothetical protein STCU_10355 [Strigomonas culicis]|eukprot:EPY17875.1 hypothetical protein STCU_10355 [Strigomonas culicis]
MPGRSQSVVGLARACLDALSPEEAEELLCVFERFDESDMNESEFVENTLMYVRECQRVDTSYVSPLLTKVPPQEKPLHHKPKPTDLPVITREKPDAAAIERAKAKREERMALWREEARQRQEGPDGVGALPAQYTFQPAPRRLIPEACRPDVLVAVRHTRTSELRRAHVDQQQQGRGSPEPAAPSQEREPAAAHPHQTARSLFQMTPRGDLTSTRPASQHAHAAPELFIG